MIRSGWKVMFYPGASIIHYHGQTRKQHLARDIFIIYQSRLYFFSKHYGWLTQLAVRALTASEIAARSLKELALSILTRNQRARRLELLGAYGRVMRMTFGQGA
jgi:GT2 family glycosyltransferase